MKKEMQFEVGRIYEVIIPKSKYWMEFNSKAEEEIRFTGKVIQICDTHITFEKESTVRYSYQKWDLSFAIVSEVVKVKRSA